MSETHFTPREVVGELDEHIVGQPKAKRAVAIALRNRWRRQQLSADLRDDVTPKNILMVGPTGVGKTEIARRLARLARAPFVKVEASKFTEVGYVGRDVESIIRDLVENAIQLVQAEEAAAVAQRAKEAAEDRVCRLIAISEMPAPEPRPNATTSFGPFTMPAPPPPTPEPPASAIAELRKQLRAGQLDHRELDLELESQASTPLFQLFGQGGNEEIEVKMRDAFSQIPGFGPQKKKRRIKVIDAMPILVAEEQKRLVDSDQVQRLAVERAQSSGIVFLDEIDKIAGRQAGGVGGPDVSREGVQRDLLPIVEGSTVSTKYGLVKTDHVLFIAAGAFHVAKVSDLIPELQGRFPIRVELEPLGEADLRRILVEPKSSLIKQYQALLATEGVSLDVTDDAVDALARYAAEANAKAENIGARRLHTILEALFEEVAFTASERSGEKIVMNGADVARILDPIVGHEDAQRYIL